MAGPEKNKGRSAMNYSDDPPPLSITNWKLSDLPEKRKRWSADHLPVDILLLTVEDSIVPVLEKPREEMW